MCTNLYIPVYLFIVHIYTCILDDTFNMRQKNAIDLKQSTDRAERMDDKQLAQLRADIKVLLTI